MATASMDTEIPAGVGTGYEAIWRGIAIIIVVVMLQTILGEVIVCTISNPLVIQ
jgi:hypothetical protein